jgi:hypothetical protein
VPLFQRRSRRPEPARASFLVDVRLLATDEGGRQGPVYRGYRSKLHLGQRLRNGSRIDWDCMWSLDGFLRPGEEARIAVRLDTLPDIVLQETETVEFYEGDRRVATGWIAAILPGDTQHFQPLENPQVVVMRNAFDGTPITSVFHEADGDWQFLTGRPDPGTAQRRHLSEVLALDPALRELAGLPRGTWAHRDAPDQPWQVEEDPEVPVG